MSFSGDPESCSRRVLESGQPHQSCGRVRIAGLWGEHTTGRETPTAGWTNGFIGWHVAHRDPDWLIRDDPAFQESIRPKD